MLQLLSPYKSAIAASAAGLHFLQAIVYYWRMPDSMACKFGLSMEPSRWCGKAFYFLSTLMAVCLLFGVSLFTPPQITLTIASIQIFLAAVNQYVFSANVGSGRLHRSFLVFVVVAPVLFVMALLSSVKP